MKPIKKKLQMNEERRRLFLEAIFIKAKVEAIEKTIPILRDRAEHGSIEEQLAVKLTFRMIRRDIERMQARALEIKKELAVLEELEGKDWNENLKEEGN